ncbi:MAG: alcohol dehydrogenase [Thermoprotei archaeon]|nr:MAG: alcohol dehydrogenase [Thermoprotei archaeon]
MNESMKALIIYKGEEASIEEIPIPKVGPNDVLIEVKACGICKTDIEIYRGTVELAKYPVIPGHEFSGVVVKVGEAVENIRRGDRVVVDPNIPCGRCYYCRTARKHFCENWEAIGVTRNGAYAKYVVAPAHVVYKTPDNMPFEISCLTEPVACVLHGIRKISPHIGCTVAIFGAGPIGLMFLQLLRAVASKVIVLEINEVRCDFAYKMGADVVINPLRQNVEEEIREITNGKGVDIAIDATGNVQAIETALRIVMPTGKVLFFGVAHKDAFIKIRPFDIYRRELTLVGSFTNPYTMDEAIRVLNKGLIEASKIITHKIDLNRALAVLKEGPPKDGIKIVITNFD